MEITIETNGSFESEANLALEIVKNTTVKIVKFYHDGVTIEVTAVDDYNSLWKKYITVYYSK